MACRICGPNAGEPAVVVAQAARLVGVRSDGILIQVDEIPFNEAKT